MQNDSLGIDIEAADQSANANANTQEHAGCGVCECVLKECAVHCTRLHAGDEMEKH